MSFLHSSATKNDVLHIQGLQASYIVHSAFMADPMKIGAKIFSYPIINSSLFKIPSILCSTVQPIMRNSYEAISTTSNISC